MTLGLEQWINVLENYYWLAIIGIMSVALFVALVRFWSPAARRLRARGPLPRSLPFRARRLVSNAELEALRFLRTAHPGVHVNVATRLVDVVTPVRGLSAAERREARNMVRAMHVDFLLCDAGMTPVLAVELDDSSHDSPAARRREIGRAHV